MHLCHTLLSDNARSLQILIMVVHILSVFDISKPTDDRGEIIELGAKFLEDGILRCV